MLRFLAAAPLALALSACAAAGSSGAPVDPFSAAYEPPREIRSDRVLLEPLGPEHAELDYAAVMGSREHLRRTLRWGDWPRDDMTLDEDRADLVRHAREFAGHAAYAYTVLSPDRSRCLGCVYLDPADDEAEVPGARLFLWVVEDELAADLDRHVLELVLRTFAGPGGPFDRLVVPIVADDERGLTLARGLGLREAGRRGVRVQFVRGRG